MPPVASPRTARTAAPPAAAGPPPVEAVGLTRRFAGTTAVCDVSFRVEHGTVLALLGANGSGKTTLLELVVGFLRPTSGTVELFGHAAGARGAARDVGVALRPPFHPGRTALAALTVHAVASGTPRERVEEVLEEVGLRAEARRRVGTFSLGMQQRLSIGLALLRRPSLLVLDEPTNGLDPDGIHWLRETLRAHARRGGSAIVSSHALAEVAQVADHALVLHQGRSLAAGPIDDLLAAARPPSVHVRTAAPERLVAVLAAAGLRATASGPATVRVDGASGEQVHAAAVTGAVAVAELVEVRPTLEEVFLRLSHQPTPPGATPSILEEEPCCAAHVQSC